MIARGLRRFLRYSVIIIVLYFVALYNILIVYISLSIIRSLKGFIHLTFLRCIITLELRGSKSTIFVFGLFLILRVSETYRCFLSLFSSIIALSIACFRCLIVAAGKSFVLIFIYVLKTRSINIRPLGLIESLIAFTAIYNKTFLFISRIFISKILYILCINI